MTMVTVLKIQWMLHLIPPSQWTVITMVLAITLIQKTIEHSPTATSIWSDQNTSELGNGWYQSSWFGYFFGNSGGWTYHSIHKWIYLSEINDGGLWIYDEQLGWLYTNQEIFPYLYQNSSNHWLYDQSDTNSRKFWDSSTYSFIYPN